MTASIISCSRRSDIPAFHGRWLMQRLRAGFVDVVNPFNPNQVRRASLARDDVAGLVLWTRHPRPLRPFLDELDDRCGPPLWLVTLNGYPRLLEPRRPATASVVEELHRLAARHGRASVHWRYDPIVTSSLTPASFHVEQVGELSAALRGAVDTCHVSFVDRSYQKTRRRMAQLKAQGLVVTEPTSAERAQLLDQLGVLTRAQGIDLVTCCHAGTLRVQVAGCVTAATLRRIDGRALSDLAAKPTRAGCRCEASIDIGSYDTCSMGCAYCYATRSDAAGKAGRRALQARTRTAEMPPAQVPT